MITSLVICHKKLEAHGIAQILQGRGWKVPSVTVGLPNSGTKEPETRVHR